MDFHPDDDLEIAKRILSGIEDISDPAKRVQTIEEGIDLLDKYIRETPCISEGGKHEIKELRSFCVKNILSSLREVRGGAIKPWMDHVGVLLRKMKPELNTVLQGYTQNTRVFPQPVDTAIVQISPPPFIWEPVDGASGYRLLVKDDLEQVIYEKTVGPDPIHVPDEIFPPGNYRWDIRSFKAKGKEQSRRGVYSFLIPEQVPTLSWVDPAMLLARVPKEHSRFLYLKSDVSSIRTTLHTTRQRSWRNCLAAAEKALETPVPDYPTYQRNENPALIKLGYQQYVRRFNQIIDKGLMELSLAFLITEQPKYAHAAKRILLEVAGWPANDGDGTALSARWGDEPALSLARCGHRAYDWLFDAFTPAERSTVLAMCETRAWQTYRRLVRCNYLACPGESHNGRLIAYLAEMAIVLAHEVEGPLTWLTYALKAFLTFYPHWGGMDGGWAEGTTYGQTYNLKYIPAFETLRNITGIDLWKRPFFQKTRYFFFYCTAIRGEISPFGDNSETGGAHTFRKHGFASLMWHHGHRFNDPYVGWWVNQIQDWSGPTGELALLFEDKLECNPPTDLPQARCFPAVGWAALHSDLSRPDQDTLLLFKSSPFGSVSHSHADQNTFCILKGGKALVIPSGYYGPAAGMPHHVQWTQSTKANNCILVNGNGQPIQERRASGVIMAFAYKEDRTYVAGDATAAYMGLLTRFIRHILFLPPGLILLLDELEAPSPALFQWMLHAFDEFDIDHSMGRVLSKRNGASLEIYLRSSAGLTFSQTDQFDTPFNEGVPEHLQREIQNHWHLTVETEEKCQRLRIGAIMGVRGPDERLKISLLDKSDGWLGAQAQGDFGQSEGWIQLVEQKAGPDGYGGDVANGQAMFCGKSSVGHTFVQSH